MRGDSMRRMQPIAANQFSWMRGVTRGGVLGVPCAVEGSQVQDAPASVVALPTRPGCRRQVGAPSLGRSVA